MQTLNLTNAQRAKSVSILKALACDKRLEIVKSLLSDKRCCTNISDCVKLDISTISRHMKELEQAGIVKGSRKGKHVHYVIINKKAVLHLLDSAAKIAKGGIA